MFLNKSIRFKRLRSPDVCRSTDSKRLGSRLWKCSSRVAGKTTKKGRKHKVPKLARELTRPYAIEAMKFYNEDTPVEYQLVEPGFINTVVRPTCFLHHIDFIAKKIGVADAQEEMFFAELTTSWGYLCQVLRMHGANRLNFRR